MKRLLLVPILCIATEGKGQGLFATFGRVFVASPEIKSVRKVGDQTYVKYYPEISHEATSVVIGGGFGAMTVLPLVGISSLFESIGNFGSGKKSFLSLWPLLPAVTIGTVAMYVPLKIGAAVANWRFRKNDQNKATKA